ncbi:retropepsin-like aspartic protease, partial [Salmonella enterica]|uniref:retropepsin-like aspartic protease n=1 Tax=Salmonella enterica TaxID=28901 RepID=UPI001F45EAD0
MMRDCPNIRRVLLGHDGDYFSEKDEDEPVNPFADLTDEGKLDTAQDIHQPDGDTHLSIVARSLTTSVVQDSSQQTNIFHSHAKVNGRVVVLIVDGGSCTNVASAYMVEKLNLPTIIHPHPYRLQWLDNSEGYRVNKQVRVPYAIGKFEGEV